MRRSRLAAALTTVIAAGCGGPTPPPPPPPPATVASITLTVGNPTMAPGATQALTAVARNAAGGTVSASFTWRSTETGVATVDASGMVTAVAPGTTSLTASTGTVTSNAVSLTVAVPVAPAARVEIDKSALLLPAGGATAQLTARVFDAQGAPTTATVTWTSSAPANVSVDATGRVTAVRIGSAQIYATADGVRSPGAFAVVAEPAAGALLLSDAQVVSVGPPLGLAPGDTPTVGTEYEVRLRNVTTAPAAGTMVLAAESAPVAGEVVSSRTDAGDLVLRLAIAPLYRLFRDYHIIVDVDLASPATAGSGLAPAAPIVSFGCERQLETQLLGRTVSATPTGSLMLRGEHRPGYSRQALEGSALIEASAGLQLQVGFSASGKCEASVRLPVPITGFFTVLGSATGELGIGASIDGHVQLASGTLGVTGKVGVSVEIGWECGGATPDCRALQNVSPVNEFETKSTFPSENGIEAEIAGQFYLFVGIGAAALGGLYTADFVRFQAGPKQSFWLATEKDQAAREDYRARYDLTLEKGVFPGSTLKKAIDMVFEGAEVSFSATTSSQLAESPRGTLTASKSKVKPNEPVVFNVQLVASSLTYPFIDENVDQLVLYRKREDESDFSKWQTMNLVGTGLATYSWTPGEADAGKYQIAAFVKTKVPTPLLEIADNSIVPVEVECASGLMAVRAGTTAPVCQPQCDDIATVDSFQVDMSYGYKAVGLESEGGFLIHADDMGTLKAIVRRQLATPFSVSWAGPLEGSASVTQRKISGDFLSTLNGGGPLLPIEGLRPNATLIVDLATCKFRLLGGASIATRLDDGLGHQTDQVAVVASVQFAGDATNWRSGLQFMGSVVATTPVGLQLQPNVSAVVPYGFPQSLGLPDGTIQGQATAGFHLVR